MCKGIPLHLQVLYELQSVHHAKKAHRNITPSAILLTPEGAARLAPVSMKRKLSGGLVSGLQNVIGTSQSSSPFELDIAAIGRAFCTLLAGKQTSNLQVWGRKGNSEAEVFRFMVGFGSAFNLAGVQALLWKGPRPALSCSALPLGSLSRMIHRA